VGQLREQTLAMSSLPDRPWYGRSAVRLAALPTGELKRVSGLCGSERRPCAGKAPHRRGV